eukprot:EG_transcript_16596
MACRLRKVTLLQIVLCISMLFLTSGSKIRSVQRVFNSRQVNGTLTLLCSSGHVGWLYFLVRQLHAFRKFNVENWVIVAGDVEMLDICNNYTLPCVSGFDLLGSPEARHRADSTDQLTGNEFQTWGWNLINFMKTHAQKLALELGLQVLFIEADILFDANPWQMVHPWHCNQTPMLMMDETEKNYNTGLIYTCPTDDVKKLYATWTRLEKKILKMDFEEAKRMFPIGEQSAFNSLPEVKLLVTSAQSRGDGFHFGCWGKCGKQAKLIHVNCHSGAVRKLEFLRNACPTFLSISGMCNGSVPECLESDKRMLQSFSIPH